MGRISRDDYDEYHERLSDLKENRLRRPMARMRSGLFDLENKLDELYFALEHADSEDAEEEIGAEIKKLEEERDALDSEIEHRKLMKQRLG